MAALTDSTGALQIAEFSSTTVTGSVAAPNDYGLVASLDGCKWIVERAALYFVDMISVSEIDATKSRQRATSYGILHFDPGSQTY